MTKVTMKGQVSGTRDGKRWPKPGETVDVPTDEADSLVAQGMAEKAKKTASKSGSESG